MENPPLQLEPLRPPSNPTRWIRYGAVCGFLGLAFVGIILGPVAIYFGARALRETTPNYGKSKLAPVLAIGLESVRHLLVPDPHYWDHSLDRDPRLRENPGTDRTFLP